MNETKLSTEERQKLHAEINQIVNQRFALTTLSITIFGAMLAWIIPSNTRISEVGSFNYAILNLLLIVLFLLFFLSQRLGLMIRTISTYLIVKDSSIWEKDWANYRKSSYLGYTKPQSVVYIVLGIILFSFPFILWAAFNITLEPRWGIIITSVSSLFYTIFIFGMGFYKWFDSEVNAKAKWVEQLNNN